MATPITWKNINNPANSAGAVNARSGALDSSRFAFEAMSKSFESAIKRQQGIRTDNRENTIDNNTQGFNDLMSQYKSPEEIEAARKEGVFGDYLEQKGGMIDRDVANQGAVDSRVTGLRQAQTAEREYDRSEQRFGNTDQRNAFEAAIASRDMDGAQSIFEANKGSWVEPGKMQQQMTGVSDWQKAEDRRLLEQGRVDDKYNLTQSERVLRDSIDDTVVQAVQDYDFEGGQSISQGRQALLDSLPEGASAPEREAAVAVYERRVMQNTTMAEGDQRIIQPMIAEVVGEYDLNNNVLHLESGSNPVEDIRDLRDSYTDTNEDGDVELLGISDGDKRKRIETELMEYRTSGFTDEDGKKFPVPKTVLETAIRGLKDQGWFGTTGELSDTIKDTIGSDWYMSQYENYQKGTARITAIEEQAFRGLMNENRTGTQTPEQPQNVPTSGLDRATQKVDLNNETPGKPLPKPVTGQPTADERPPEPEVPWQDRNVLDTIGAGFRKFGESNDARYRERVNEMKEIANGDTNLPHTQFLGMLSSNPSILNELSDSEVDKLKSKFGTELIKNYLN